MDGLTGLKSLGVRDLTYKLAFLATSICSSNPTVIFIIYLIKNVFFSLVVLILHMKKLVQLSYGKVY